VIGAEGKTEFRSQNSGKLVRFDASKGWIGSPSAVIELNLSGPDWATPGFCILYSVF
jgi:hypothetical protein